MANRRSKPAKNRVVECLTKGCSNEGTHARGNCRDCYTVYHSQVRAGVVTWDDLVKSKQTLPAYTRRADRPKSPAELAVARVK